MKTKEIWLKLSPKSNILEVRQGNHFGFLAPGEITALDNNGDPVVIYHRGDGEVLVYPD